MGIGEVSYPGRPVPGRPLILRIAARGFKLDIGDVILSLRWLKL